MDFSPDGKKLMIENRIWSVPTGQLLHEFDTAPIRFSPDGKYILALTATETLLIDATTYRTVHELGAGDTRNWQFSPDGHYLLFARGDNAIDLWNVETSALLHQFEAATGYGVRATFLEGDSVLMAQSLDEINDSQTIVLIRDTKTGAELRSVVIGMPIYHISTNVVVTPDEKYLAIASFSGTLSLWDIQTGKQVRQFC